MDASARAEQVYRNLTQEPCPHDVGDGQIHLKSACRRCTIEGYAQMVCEVAADERERAATLVESWADRIGGFEAQQLAKELRDAK